MPHTDDKVCLTVGVWIVHEDKVLLRLHDKFGVWMGVGGHIDPGEDPLEAAHREAMEEVGLEIQILGEPSYEHGDEWTDLPVPAFVNRHAAGKGHDHFNLEFFATSISMDITQPDNHERTECKWCTEEDVAAFSDAELLPNARKYALAALNALGSKPL